MTASPETRFELEVAAVTDVGTERENNEDECGHLLENEACGLLVVADGVSSAEAGETASQTAVAAILRTFSDQPAGTPTAKRLYRAVQQANIEIYERAYAIPELRGMTTTLTAVALERGDLTAVHVGDSRLYLVRAGTITQLTKDHTLAEERLLAGFASKERALADRSALTRSVGRELIVSRDRISRQLVQNDVLLLCSDGLYNVLADAEMQRIVADRDAPAACRALIEEANGRGTPDNVTAAMVRMIGPAPTRPEPGRLLSALRRLRGRPAS
jgi:PPM family protein phosphatase